MTTLFLMLDGLRPDAITAAQAENLIQFQHTSAYTLTAQSIMPTITLPCHVTLFHSVPASRHGILDNEHWTTSQPVRGLFEQLKAHDRRCASIYNWEPFRELNRPGSLAMNYFADTCYEIDGDRIMADFTVDALRRGDLDFIFTYFATIDLAGHAHGWMSDGYLAQVREVDRLVGQVLDAAPADAIVLIQADHGGHDQTHGTDLPEDMTIPWMIAGRGIRSGHCIRQPVNLLDTAPTLADVLGVPPDPQWQGRVISEIYI